MSKRILFVDILRGGAILGVILVHGLIYGVWYSEGNALDVLPDAALAVLGPIVLLATWAGIFAIMSSLVNSYNALNKVKDGKSLNHALRGPLVNSTIIFIIHLIYRVGFTHKSSDFNGNELNSVISGIFVTGDFVEFNLVQLFKAEALLMIAVVGWFSTLVMALLWRNEGWKKTDRNMRIMLYLAIAWVIAYFFVYPPLRDVYVNWYNIGVDGQPIYLVLAFFLLKWFVAGQQVLLPYAGFGLIGVIYGVWISDGKSYNEMWKFTWRLSLGFFFAAIIWNIIDFTVLNLNCLIGQAECVFGTGVDLDTRLDFINIPPNLAWLNMSLMVLVVMALYKYFDKQTDEVKIKRANRWNLVRRFGMMALTVYFFESTFHAAIARLFHSIFGDVNAEQDAFMLNAPAIILYVAILFVFWFVVLKFWERYNYVGTMEWIHVNVGALFRPEKSDRLAVKEAKYTAGD